MPTNLEFLEPGFDPKTLKVPQLRRILTENDVQIPSKAKKNTLLRLYNKDIVPQLDTLRDKYENVKPSSKGIKEVKRHEQTKKPEKTKDVKETSNEKKRTREAVKKEEDQEESTKKSSSKVQDTTGDDEHKKKKKKTKKTKKDSKKTEHKKESSAKSAPEIKEVPTSPVKSDSEVEFTQKENKTVKREVLKPNLSKLRVSPEFAALLKNATAGYEHQEQVNVEQTKAPTKVVVDIVSNSEEEEEEELESTELKENKGYEEDSKETRKHSRLQWPTLRFRKSSKETAQPETVKIQSEKPKSKCCLSKCNFKCIALKKLNCQAVKHCFFNAFIFTLIIIPIIYCIWYRQQRIVIGYCDRELPLKSVVPSCLQSFCLERFSINLSFIDNWLSLFKPNCLFCPESAICFPNMELTCHTQHRKILPLLSINKLIPLSEYCIPDVRKQEFVNRMISKFVTLLQKQNAKLNCGNAKNQKLNSIPRSVLHNIFEKKVDSKWSSREVSDLWELTLKKLNKLPEVRTFHLESHDGEVMTAFVRSTSKERTSIACKYGDAIKSQLYRHKILLSATTLFFTGAILLNCYLQKRAEYNDNVEEYVTVTIEKLKDQTEDGKDGTFLHTLQLRDVVLAAVVDLNQRKKIWKSMSTVMKKNKHIICALTEINGEILECWSWKKEEETD